MPVFPLQQAEGSLAPLALDKGREVFSLGSVSSWTPPLSSHLQPGAARGLVCRPQRRAKPRARSWDLSERESDCEEGPTRAHRREVFECRLAMGLWGPLASAPPHWPSSTGRMYHGDLTEKLKALYKLHLPPGESLPTQPPTRASSVYRAGAAACPGTGLYGC